MKQFTAMNLWPTILLNIFELAACITGFLYWDQVKKTYWRWFPFYLGIIFFSEITGEFLVHSKQTLQAGNAVYKYFAVPLEFFFFYWLFYRCFNTRTQNKLLLFPLPVYLACLLIDVFYIEGKMKLLFDSFSYVVGCILLLILILKFFIDFINSDELLRYRSNRMFWVTVGLMLFYIGSLPFWGLRTTLYKQHRDFFYIYWYIQFALNYLMYIFFIISFIWAKPK